MRITRSEILEKLSRLKVTAVVGFRLVLWTSAVGEGFSSEAQRGRRTHHEL